MTTRWLARDDAKCTPRPTPPSWHPHPLGDTESIADSPHTPHPTPSRCDTESMHGLGVTTGFTRSPYTLVHRDFGQYQKRHIQMHCICSNPPLLLLLLLLPLHYSTSTTPLLLLNAKPQDLEDPSPTLRQTEGYRGMDAILALRRRFEHHFLHKMRGDQPRGASC